jgi:hypothetical protein
MSEPWSAVRLESEPPSFFGVPRSWPPARTGKASCAFLSAPVPYPATSESEKVSFSQLNRKTGHRIKYLTVDSDI